MSQVNYESLKSPRDQNIPFLSRKFQFTTSQLLFDTLLQFGMLIKSYRIVNNVGINNLTFRNKSLSNVLETIEPNTEALDDDWSSFFEINPNAATGSGSVEFELVQPKDAYRG
jgi:hypothetical protein